MQQKVNKLSHVYFKSKFRKLFNEFFGPENTLLLLNGKLFNIQGNLRKQIQY